MAQTRKKTQSKKHNRKPQQQKFEVKIPLIPEFRYIHEPLDAYQHDPMLTSSGNDEHAVWERFIGRDQDLHQFVNRVMHSSGGAFLIAGYRGIGKTSFINRAIYEIKKRVEENEMPLHIVDIRVDIAVSIGADQLMHFIVRCMYDRLNELDLFSSLSEPVQEKLILAYQRTSYNIVRKEADGVEKGVELGGTIAAVTNLKGSGKATRNVETSQELLGYDNKAAERDVISLARLLSKTPLQNKRMFLQRKQPDKFLKIIFVFDEMDKIEQIEDIAEIFRLLKSLFTTSGITFVFVTGKNLHDQWFEEMRQGNSLFESIFTYDQYLPCMWDSTDLFSDQFVKRKPSKPRKPKSPLANPQAVYGYFKSYLKYKGRGIPRRIVRVFNEQVSITGKGPMLGFTIRDGRRFRFYAQLQELLENEYENIIIEEFDPSEKNRDQSLLWMYYVLDWIWVHGTKWFTFEDLVDFAQKVSHQIVLDEEVDEENLRQILDILIEHDYIAKKDHLNEAMIDDALPRDQYHLHPQRLIEMSDTETQKLENEMKQEALAVVETNKTIDSRYILEEEVGRGGVGVVYKARDKKTRKTVAVKIFHQNLFSSPLFFERLKREANLMRLLEHPNIRAFIDLVHTSDDAYYMVTEFIDGVTLQEAIDSTTLTTQESIEIIKQVAQGVCYAHKKNIVRLDLKPGNIMIDKEGKVSIIDLGIAKSLEALEEETMITGEGVAIGTPAFAAPEQFTGGTVDVRTDIYSLGAILYNMVTGERPYTGNDIYEIFQKQIRGDLPEIDKLSPEMRSVIKKCLATQKENRYQNVNAFLQELLNVDDMAGILSGPQEMKALKLLGIRLSDHRTRAADIKVRKTKVPLDDSHVPVQKPKLIADVRISFSGNNAFVEILDSGMFPDMKQTNYEFKEKIRVGRTLDNDIAISNDSDVSRYHAEFFNEGDDWLIKDSNSANGTLLNGEYVEKPRKLMQGDVLRIGKTLIQVVDDFDEDDPFAAFRDMD